MARPAGMASARPSAAVAHSIADRTGRKRIAAPRVKEALKGANFEEANVKEADIKEANTGRRRWTLHAGFV